MDCRTASPTMPIRGSENILLVVEIVVEVLFGFTLK